MRMQRMRRALAEYQVRGIRTTIPFFQWILEDEDFKAGRFDTGFIDRKLGGTAPAAGRSSRRTKISRRSPPRCTCSPSRPPTAWPRRRAEPLARRRPHGSAAMIFEVAIGDQRAHRRHRPQGRHAARRSRRPHARRRCAAHQRLGRLAAGPDSTMRAVPSQSVDAAFASRSCPP